MLIIIVSANYINFDAMSDIKSSCKIIINPRTILPGKNIFDECRGIFVQIQVCLAAICCL